MNAPPAKLFRAVVVSGAALTGGCREPAVQEVTITPLPPHDGNALTAATTTSTDSAASTAPPASTGTTTLRRVDGGCPPGSERPYPPCYYIR